MVYLSVFAYLHISVMPVISKQVYCNSPFCNIAHKDIRKLRVQNCSARAMTRYPCITRSVQLLKSLHWLPARYRIIFNVCSITYQVLLSCKQPSYLHSFRTPVRKAIQLRTSSSDLLFVPIIETMAFSIAVHMLFGICFFVVLDLLKMLPNSTVILKTYKYNLSHPP